MKLYEHNPAIQQNTSHRNTVQDFQGKRRGTKVWVKCRQNGTVYAEGLFITELKPIRQLSAIVLVEFPDGVEPFSLDQILFSPPPSQQLTLI